MGDQRPGSRKASTSSGGSELERAAITTQQPSGPTSPESSASSKITLKSIPTERRNSSQSVAELRKSSVSSPGSGSRPNEKISVQDSNSPTTTGTPNLLKLNNRRQSGLLTEHSPPSSAFSLQNDEEDVPDGSSRPKSQLETPSEAEIPVPAARRRSSAASRKHSALPLGSDTPDSISLLTILNHKNSSDNEQQRENRRPFLESDVELPSVTDGAISNMWKQENHFSSSARTSEPKRQRISELVTELRNLTKTDDNQSDEEISTSAPVASKGSVKMPNQTDRPRESRTNSTNQRPYNVIFESDEAISVSTTEGKDPRIRVPRSKIPGSFSHNEGRDSGNGSSVILALKNGSLSDDGELQKILDVWYGQLRQALMAENVTARDRVLAELDKSMKEMMKSQEKDADRLHSDIDSLHNLCRSYSRAIRDRDQTIANLADALAGLNEQVLVARSSALWQNEAEENRRQDILYQVAVKYHQKKVMQDTWNVWRSVLQNNWRGRVEKACQKRAEEVCLQMADQYDQKIAALEETIKRLRDENKTYKEDRDRVTVKARDALLHGVTVLKAEVKRFPEARDGSDGAAGRDSRNEKSADTRHFRSRDSGESEASEVPKRRGQSIGAGPLLPFKFAKNQPFVKSDESGRSGSPAASASGSSSGRSSRDDGKGS